MHEPSPARPLDDNSWRAHLSGLSLRLANTRARCAGHALAAPRRRLASGRDRPERGTHDATPQHRM
eukprot:3492085-Prymnesium_polylepis.1